MPENILITGGAGYIGSHVNLELHRRGYKTIIIDNLSSGHAELVPHGTLVITDIGDQAGLRDVFKAYDIDAVMHFAAHAYVGESVQNPAKYYANNVINTLRLLGIMKEFNVDKIIFSSTCAIYGIPEEIPISESCPTHPVSPYGRTKLMVEQILKDYSVAHGLNYVSLRYFNAAGADENYRIGEWHVPETHLIPRLLESASNPDFVVELFGTDYDTFDGTCVRDYIHVSDLADAHIIALTYLLQGGISDCFNLGNGNGFSVKEIVNAASDVTGIKLKITEAVRRDGDPAILVGNTDKIREKLGWQPKFTDIDEIIRTAWQWHRYKNKQYGAD